MGFPSGSVLKNLSVNAGDMSSIPCQEDPLKKEMATHYSIAWEIPWTGEHGGYSLWGHEKELNITLRLKTTTNCY